MSTTPPSTDRFQTLLTEFCAEMQMPVDDQALGLEFEADGHIVLFAPDPRNDQRLQIEVSVMRLERPSTELMLALHQLNHQSRLEHDWVISIDLTNQLTLHSQRLLEGCRPRDLSALLSEGIDRAQALVSLCQAMAAVAATTATPAAGPSSTMGGDPALMMIRG